MWKKVRVWSSGVVAMGVAWGSDVSKGEVVVLD